MIDGVTYWEYGQEMIVIREIFDGAHELFENELERAFEFGCPTIIIEPCRLGEETARWIYFGEYLTHYSILTGLGSLLVSYCWPEKSFLQYSLLGTALLTHGINLTSWQQDICSHYRVERNPEKYLRDMATKTINSQNFDDSVSLVTTQEISSQDDLSINDDKELDDEKERGTDKTIKTKNLNRYEMILNTAVRKRKSPVVLCRRTDQEMKRTKWLNAAVSLLALAYSFFRLVRSSFFKSSPKEIPKPPVISKTWSILKYFPLI